MKIITANINECLNAASWYPMAINNIGGTVRVVLATAQVVANLVLLLLVSPFASCCKCLKDYHWSIVGRDLLVGFGHIGRGLLEQIPFSGYAFAEMDIAGKCFDRDADIIIIPRVHPTDNPFDTVNRQHYRNRQGCSVCEATGSAI